MADHKIIVAIASHINNEKRLANFDVLFDSIVNQSILPFCVLMSISYEPGNDVTKFVEKCREKSSGKFAVICLLHQGKLSQFQNYRRLLPVLERYEDKWILFSDDDDEWHPYRLELYHTSIDRAIAEDLIAMRCIHYKDRGCKCDTNYYITKAGNYIEYLTKIKTFVKFLRNAQANSLSEKYADVYWERCIASSGKYRGIVCSGPDNWMYDWKNHDYPSNCTTLIEKDANVDRVKLYLARCSEKHRNDNSLREYTESAAKGKDIPGLFGIFKKLAKEMRYLFPDIAL